MYEERGERQEGGTCSGRKMGELGRAGGHAGMGQPGMGRKEWDVRLGEMVKEGWRKAL